MALITRCPACGTRFKVVPDQLRISDGWVRCGECAEVFDASADLHQSEADPAPAPEFSGFNQVAPQSPIWHDVAEPLPSYVAWAPSGLEEVPIEEPPFPESAVPPVLSTWDAAVVPQALPEAVELRGEPLIAESDVASQDEAPSPSHAEKEPDGLVDLAQKEVLAEEAAVEESASTLLPIEPMPEEFPEPLQPVPHAEPEAVVLPSFLEQAPAPQTLWRRPALRKALMAGSVLLVALFGLQAAMHQRDPLAARFPAAKPWLEGLCRPLGCSVQALRQIESIVIDNSTFTTLRHGVYRLNVVLKNRAPLALAVPAIELALTDTQEQPVFRRVLRPGDMADVPGSIGPDGEWTASVELSVADEASIARIVGYRLLAFYP